MSDATEGTKRIKWYNPFNILKTSPSSPKDIQNGEGKKVEKSEICKVGEEPATCSVDGPSMPSGWWRLRAVYTDGNVHMEPDVTMKMAQLSFCVGSLIGGLSGYATAKQRYEMHTTGKTFISPKDAVRRRWDYAIVMFAKHGFSMGCRSAALIGSVVFFTTHLSLWRNRFSGWYFPAVSGVTTVILHRVFSMLAFPLGLVGTFKALCLGVSSGCSLSAIIYLYGMSVNMSMNEVYDAFKKEYEEDQRKAKDEEKRLENFMAERNIRWRANAIRQMKKEDEAKLLEDLDDSCSQ